MQTSKIHHKSLKFKLPPSFKVHNYQQLHTLINPTFGISSCNQKPLNMHIYIDHKQGSEWNDVQVFQVGP